ncbi:MAG: hypothetical protein ACOCUS_07460 [Polyangiales bacterium]
MRQIVILYLSLALLPLAGCDEGGQSEDIEPTADEGPSTDDEGAGATEGKTDEGGDPAAQGDEGAEASGPVVQTDSYRLAAEPEGEYAKGELGQFAITLTGQGKWYINQEFGTKVKITAPDDFELPKSELEQEEAAEFGEEKARFDVPFTPGAAGEHQLEAEVEFAMCTPETCVPKTQKLAVLLPVK